MLNEYLIFDSSINYCATCYKYYTVFRTQWHLLSGNGFETSDIVISDLDTADILKPWPWNIQNCVVQRFPTLNTLITFHPLLEPLYYSIFFLKQMGMEEKKVQKVNYMYTWLDTGLCLRPGLLSSSSSWRRLKLDTPRDLTRPASLHASSACGTKKRHRATSPPRTSSRHVAYVRGKIDK